TVDAVFTVSLSAASSSSITVDYMTLDGTATSVDNDYLPRVGTVTFPANDTSPQTISVSVVGDIKVEPDETFFVSLTATPGITIARGQGAGTIRNDEAPCTYSISPSSATWDFDVHGGNITVNAPPGCSWTGSSNVGWLLVDNPNCAAGVG